MTAADDARDDDRFDAGRFDEHGRQYGQPSRGQGSYGQVDHFQDHYDDGWNGDAHGAPYYDEGVPMAPRDEDMYDDPPRSRGRNGLITAVTLIGCAALGTAAAYGYRTYYSGYSSTKAPPPVIAAETMPSKVVASVDPQASKAFQDRAGEQGQGERVVSREEQPLDPTIAPMPSPPRVVLPMPVAPSQPHAAAPIQPPPPRAGSQGTVSGPASGATSGSATGNGEPKRIRTVTIRPDPADLSGPTSGQPAQTRSGAAAKASQPGRNTETGPLSLDPQAGASVLPPQTRERTSAALPPTPAPAQTLPSMERASVPANSGPGGYVVQLSSQRSEAEAQASFRSLQAKFPDQLSGRTPIIQRANLKDKGTYYRAMVGPFANAEEASRFCGGYRAAGGQCIIQKN